MGSLTKLPLSEITATLERLEQGGVTPEILKLIRTDCSMARRVAGAILRTTSWHQVNGIIYFSVTSDGTTGKGWIKRLEGNGFLVGDHAKSVFRSPNFKPTKGITTEVVVLPGCLFEENDRTTAKIRAEGALRKLVTPNAELACLIREKFRDKEIEAMGLIWIVAMHEPINDPNRGPLLLSAIRGDGGPLINASHGWPDNRWSRGHGFAFAVSPQ